MAEAAAFSSLSQLRPYPVSTEVAGLTLALLPRRFKGPNN